MLATLVCALASWALHPYLSTANLGLVFLIGVLVTASRAGVGAVLFASALSFLAFNFFFTEPRHTFLISARHDVLSLVLFLAVALVTGQLAARLRMKMDAEIAYGRRMALLQDFSRRLNGAVAPVDLAVVLARYVGSALGTQAIALMRNMTSKLAVVAGDAGPDGLTDVELAAAEWALAERQTCGAGSERFPHSRWLFLPLLCERGGDMVLGVRSHTRGRSVEHEQQALLLAMRDQASTALEKLHLTAEMERGRLLAETDRLRSALLSSVSHDLRTPLVSIKGAATALLELDEALAPGDKRELLDNLVAEAERLNRYIENLLGMTRLGYGAVTPQREWHDVHEILGAAVRALKRLLDTRPVEVAVEKDGALVYTDRQLLEQVAVNLLENAAKYSPPETPIFAKATRQGDDYVLSISDFGPGIPTDERDKVFDMFHRVHATDQRAVGTGMGLAICKGLVEALGGTIQVADGDGTGTCIVVRLPQPSGTPPTRSVED